MAKMTVFYCDKCNEQLDLAEVKEVALNTPSEYISRDLCAKCKAKYDRKLLELGEWLKKEEF